MKKVLALFVVLMFATSAFAVGTNVKLLSQSDLPATMTDDNIMIGQYLISKIDGFANVVALEADDGGNAFGYMLLKSDFGTLGLSLSPSLGTVSGVSCTLPGNMLGLQWANGGIGAGLLLGLSNSGFEYADPTNIGGTPDKRARSRMLIGLQGGITLDVGMPLDLGLNVTIANQADEDTNMDAAIAGQKDSIAKTNANELGFTLLARTELSGLLVVVGGTYAMGNREVVSQIDNVGNNGTFMDAGDTNTLNKYTDSLIEAGALVGKIIKATETLKVTIATGLGFRMDGSQLTITENKVASTKTYGPMNVNSYVNAGVPLNVAVEGKLNETWRILGGIESMVITIASSGNKERLLNTDEKTETKDYYTSGSLSLDPGFSYDLGVSGTIGDLQLDLHLDPAILIYGPEFISGNNGNNSF